MVGRSRGLEIASPPTGSDREARAEWRLLARGDADLLWTLVLLLIVVHGITATPVVNLLAARSG